jgi:hypothetical protein
MTGKRRAAIDWGSVLSRAAQIVRSYTPPPTLRQLFYRLVAESLVPNDRNAYKWLSHRTSEGRRDGSFPALTDRTRRVEQIPHWTGPADALDDLIQQFALDRTEGQPFQVWLGIEKDALVGQLTAWFEERGVPIMALRGYASQTLVDLVRAQVKADERPAVLLYGGDFDPTGEDIYRDFIERTDCWAQVERVATTAEQVESYDLPPMIGKATDSRASEFLAKHGRLIQVELDALDLNDLRQLYVDALDARWDEAAHQRVLDREDEARDQLREVAEGLR